MSSIVDWSQIKDDYKESLIIGNGASIAISQNFSYSSLYKKANELGLIDNKLKKIFSDFKTTDFETVLRMLSIAKIVSTALSINNQEITSAYENCRNSLIKVIQKIHPSYDEIDKSNFINIANFMKNFHTVISLNYDLILYWSMYHGNLSVEDDGVTKSGSRFKDCFIKKIEAIKDNCFSSDWDFLREPDGRRNGSTLIFYLHGNLSLAEFINETFEKFEVKITSPQTNHLENIYKKWKTNRYFPLFVCEGEKDRKLVSINESVYLSTIYHNIFKELGENIAIYGWSMNDQDDHIVEQLHAAYIKKTFKKIAFSVCKDGNERDFVQRVFDKINKKISNKLRIDFYDSASKNCWNMVN